MVLLVRREDEVVEHLAAGDGGIVAQHGVNQTGAVFEVAVVAQHETRGRDGVENVATVTGDAVDQNHALADLRGLLLRGIDGDILQLGSALDVAVGTHFRVLENPAVLDDAAFVNRAVKAAVVVDALLGDLFEPLLQTGIVGELGPQVGVGGNHAIEGEDGATAILVHHLQLHAHLFGLTLFHHAVAELGVVGGRKLLDVEKDAAVADNVVGHVVDVVDGHIVADVAGDDTAVGDTYGHPEIMELQNLVAYTTDTHHPEETVVANHAGVEIVSHPDVVPVGGRVAVEHQPLDLVRTQMPPAAFGLLHLLVTVEILVVTVMQVFGINEVLIDSVVW